MRSLHLLFTTTGVTDADSQAPGLGTHYQSEVEAGVRTRRLRTGSYERVRETPRRSRMKRCGGRKAGHRKIYAIVEANATQPMRSLLAGPGPDGSPWTLDPSKA